MDLSAQSVQKYLEQEGIQMDAQLRVLLQSRQPASLYKSCRRVMGLKGKYVRPLLFILSIKVLGKKVKSSYHSIGLAIEMLHRASLVFDDIMDNANIRHGAKALHKSEGVNKAILTGLTFLPLSYQILLNNTPYEAISILNKALLDMNEGQSMDMDNRPKMTMEEYDLMVYKKTASLLEASCSLAAYLVGASEHQRKALACYGKYVGMAFQIRDDLLDILGDEKYLGKTKGRDIAEGKNTYLRIRIGEKSKKYKERLNIIEKASLSEEEKVSSYVRLYKELGVLDDAKERIQFFINLALHNIAIFPNSKSKKIMVSIAQSLIIN